jgi:hypothetical protein
VSSPTTSTSPASEVSGEGLIAAAAGALLGGGGLRLLSRLFAPEVAKYYREVIAHLEGENRALRRRLAKLERRVADLED